MLFYHRWGFGNLVWYGGLTQVLSFFCFALEPQCVLMMFLTGLTFDPRPDLEQRNTSTFHFRWQYSLKALMLLCARKHFWSFYTLKMNASSVGSRDNAAETKAMGARSAGEFHNEMKLCPFFFVHSKVCLVRIKGIFLYTRVFTISCAAKTK